MYKLDLPLSMQTMLQLINFYEEKQVSSYRKEDLDEIDLTSDLHSIISKFDRGLYSNAPVEKHTFILIVESQSIESQREILKDFENSVLRNLSEDEEKLESNISFQVASIYRETLEQFVPNELPLLLYIERGKSLGQSASYFWIRPHFEEMIQMLLDQKSISESPNFLNLNEFKFEEL